MSFWLGFFTGIALWKVVDLVVSIIFYGESIRIDASSIALTLMTILACGIGIAYHL